QVLHGARRGECAGNGKQRHSLALEKVVSGHFLHAAFLDFANARRRNLVTDFDHFLSLAVGRGGACIAPARRLKEAGKLFAWTRLAGNLVLWPRRAIASTKAKASLRVSCLLPCRE